MKEKMTLDCSMTLLASAHYDDGTGYVTISEFCFPWNDFHFSDTRFFLVSKRVMDFESACWDTFHNDLRSAMTAFGKEVNLKYRTGDGVYHRLYEKPEYTDEWKYFRELLMNYDESCSEKDYGPSNPWDAPGMKVSDFIKGVY